ncbi:ComEC/Rec2 family competence protein [Roseibium sp.]|uniref:ComEC/Rec2 family competence protein n=1 Tax=Roseibium sp. TaxID=1936156 RepID=UPI003D0B518C
MAREAKPDADDDNRAVPGSPVSDPSVISSNTDSRHRPAEASPWTAFLRARREYKDRPTDQHAGWAGTADDWEQFWQKQGLLWTGFSFSAGTFLYSLLPEEPSWLVLGVLFFLSACLAGAHAVRTGLPRVLNLLLALFAGLSIATLRTAAVDAPRLAEPMTVLLRGDVLKVQETRSGKRLVLRVREVDARENTDGRFANRVRLRIPADARIAPGDWIKVRARLFPPMGPVVPGGYDFSFRAYFDGIGASGFSYGAPEIVHGPAASQVLLLVRQVNKLRQHLAERISALLPEDPETALAVALLVGDRSGIDEKTEESLRAAGLAHILAISGLHMALFAGGAYAVCLGALALIPGLALRWPIHKVSAMLALVAAVFYLLLSGASVATQRSFIMIALVFLGIMTGRRGLTLRSVAIAGLFLLLLAPERLFYPGFQMSFAAVIALVAVYDLWRSHQKRRRSLIPSTNGHSWFLSGALKWATGLFVTALVAGIATGIVGAYHFSRIAPFGLVGNMLGMPVFSLIVMPMGVVALVLMPFGLAAIPLKVMSAGLVVLIQIAEFTEQIAPDFGRMGSLTGLSAAVLLAGFFGLLLAPGRFRVIGLGLVPIGITLAIISRPPDIYIPATGSQLAARDIEGALALSSARSSFAAETWFEAEGVSGEAIKSRKMKDGQRACDPSGCVVQAFTARAEVGEERIPVTIALPKTRNALFYDCQKADMIVTDMVAPAACRAVVFDQDIRVARGAISIWLDQACQTGTSTKDQMIENVVRIESAVQRKSEVLPLITQPQTTPARTKTPSAAVCQTKIQSIKYAKPKPPRPWHKQGTVTRSSLHASAD